MDERVLSILEYDKIRERLCGHTASEIGRALARELTPSADPATVRAYLCQTQEAEGILMQGGRSPVDAFPDMRMTLKRTHAALALSPAELLQIAHCLRASRNARERLTNTDQPLTLLSHMAAQLCAHRSVEEEITRCIASADEISDAASPELASLRRQMRLANERARDKLNGMVKSITFQKYLQEPIVTIRNGRFVLPVKQEARQYVPGLVHDQSGSGATLYVEPMAVVELGNEYKRLCALEQEEIARILAALTAMLEPYAEELCESLALLGALDVIFAKAAMAREMRAVCPTLQAERGLRILRGRHPLIPPAQVVPVDVWLGGNAEFTTLIITGPNTGGKTVTLKTVGLFALMAQSGLFLPAAEGTSMCLFERVLADIGDEQSIEQSLSTFSAHMTNLVEILSTADANSLVLLDELGAGTDPVEGAALAMSILETLHARGCLTAATTHYSEIKAFVLTRAGMENASMEFDVDRLCPTYRLFIGIPGKSNAFEISRRLGLGEEIIARARGFLKQEDVAFEDVIQSAQSQRQQAERERMQAEEARLELERLRASIEQQKRQMEAEKAALRAKAREEARAVVRDAREQMERIIVGLKSLKGVDARAVDRAVQQARDAARRQESALAEPMGPREAAGGKPPKAVRPGERVRLLTLGQNATVLKPADARGDVQVQAGIIKMMVNLKDMRVIEEKAPAAPASARVHLDEGRQGAGLSLDVRGRMVDEAIVEVDRYIDDAVIHGRNEISVIHGKGTGALRQGIQAYLKRHPKVKGFRLGAYGEGDAGVTVITLK